MYLAINDLTVLYDRAMVLNGVSLNVAEGKSEELLNDEIIRETYLGM